MANEKNLTHKLTESDQRKGGIASGRARREKKAVQDILNAFMDSKVSKNKVLEKLAEKAGLSGKCTTKELFVAVCLLNTLKEGKLNDLDQLSRLLGEQVDSDNGGKDDIGDDPLTKALMEEAERMNQNG